MLLFLSLNIWSVFHCKYVMRLTALSYLYLIEQQELVFAVRASRFRRSENRTTLGKSQVLESETEA